MPIFGWRLLGDLLERGGDALRESSSPMSNWLLPTSKSMSLPTCPSQPSPQRRPSALACAQVSMPEPFFYATIEQVIIPGLTAHGLDAQWAWDTCSEANLV